MAGQQVISLIINAVDKATANIGKVIDKINSIDTSTGKAKESMEDLSKTIENAMLKTHAVIRGVEFGFDKLKGALDNASKIELDNLSAASGLAGAMGGNFDKAAGFVDEMNKSLAKSAAALPGTTADYSSLARTISDDVMGGFVDAKGQIKDLTAFQKTLTSITTSYAAMGAAGGIAAGNTQLFLMKALGGTASMSELNQIDALQKNAQLRTQLNAALKAKGVTDLKQLSVQDRIKLIDDAGKKVITPEYLSRVSKTYDSIIQGFVSNLFDDQTGLFGVNRDLSDLAGNQTVFKSFEQVLSDLIGENGFFTKVAQILDSLGLSFDPMVALKAGLDWLDGFLARLNHGLDYVRMLLRYLTPEETFKELLKMLDIDALVRSYGSGVTEVFKKAGANLFNFVGNIFQNMPSGVWAAIAGVLLGTSLMQVVGAFAARMAVVFLAGTAGAPVLLAAAAAFAIWALIQAVRENWDSVVDMVTSWFGKVFDVFHSAFEVWLGVITLNKDLVMKGLGDLGNALSNMLDALRDTVANIVNPWLEKLGRPTMKTSDEIRGDEAAAKADQIYSQALQNKGLAKYLGGYIPNAASGLFDAIGREMSGKPANAGLVIANTSEAVLTQEQMRNLVNGSVATGVQSGGTFAPQINVYGISDPGEAAKRVMAEIETMFGQYQQGQLA